MLPSLERLGLRLATPKGPLPPSTNQYAAFVQQHSSQLTHLTLDFCLPNAQILMLQMAVLSARSYPRLRSLNVSGNLIALNSPRVLCPILSSAPSAVSLHLGRYMGGLMLGPNSSVLWGVPVSVCTLAALHLPWPSRDLPSALGCKHWRSI